MSGRLNRYLNQTATWSKRTGINDYGEPVYELQSEPLTCRMEKRIRNVTDNTGREIVSTMTIYIAPDRVESADKLAGDRIAGMTIQQVTELTDAYGTVIGYEVIV